MIKIVNHKNETVCKGDKNNIINFLSSKGYNVDLETPLLIISTLVKKEYSIFL